jgi:flagellar FliJ protein
MKDNDKARRLPHSIVEQKTRKVQDLERLIREFEVMAADLDREIKLEEDRTPSRDRSHFSYSTYAKSAAQRRDNLKASSEAMRRQLAEAILERDKAIEQYDCSANQAGGRVAGVISELT